MEESNRIKAPMIKSRGIVIFSLWLLVLSLASFGSANQDVGEPRIDYGAVRQDILQFEMVINGLITSTFPESSLAVVQKAKCAYVPGYGFSLSFLINIHTAVINTPFGQVKSRSGELSPESKKRRIEDLKEKLIQALLENGDGLRQLRKEECVTIIAFIEDRNFPGEPNENKTIVLKIFKKDLDEFNHRNERIKEFKQRMKIVEY
jgi:hypothetical protein